MQYLFLNRYKQSCPEKQVSLNQLSALEAFREKISKNFYSFEEVPCICGNANGLLISSCDRYGLEMKTYLCKNCGTMRTSPRMDQESLKYFYSHDYRPIYGGDSHSSESFFQEQIFHGESILNFFSNNVLLFNQCGSVVFDIGCGAGGNLVPFRKKGWNTYGCDLGGDYLKRGIKEGLVLEQGDPTILSKYGPADLIILNHVLEHMANPLEILNLVNSMLKSNGYIYVELPGIFKIHENYGDFLLFLQNAHLFHFTLTTLDQLVARAGFSLVTGDEYIHALFRKDEQSQTKVKENYLKILFYLYRLEIYRSLNLRKYLRKFN